MKYRVMNDNGTYVVERCEAGDTWEPVAWTNDIKVAKSQVRKFRELDK